MINCLRAARLLKFYAGIRLSLIIAVVSILGIVSNGQESSARLNPFVFPAQSPNPNQTVQAQPAQANSPLPIDEAVRLALAQASRFQQAQLSELIASEDVRQSRIAF